MNQKAVSVPTTLDNDTLISIYKNASFESLRKYDLARIVKALDCPVAMTPLLKLTKKELWDMFRELFSKKFREYVVVYRKDLPMGFQWIKDESFYATGIDSRNLAYRVGLLEILGNTAIVLPSASIERLGMPNTYQGGWE